MHERHPAHGADRGSSQPPGPLTGSEGRCLVCGRPRSATGSDVDPYDEDYDYYWRDIRIPLWIALIWNVPWRQRLDIFVIGFLVGLVVAAVAFIYGLILAPT